MWPDIEKISMFEKTYKISSLPKTSERLAASKFFITHTPHLFREIDFDDNLSLQQQSWLTWASIVSFPRDVSGEPLHRDLSALDLLDKWRESEERQSLNKDPLLAVLFELRNYEVHIQARKVDEKDFLPFVLNPKSNKLEERNLGKNIYIAPINFQSLSQLNNFQKGHSKVNIAMVDWFNRQATSWPASSIIGEARERYSKYITQFLSLNGI